MKARVLDEAFAMVREGLASRKRALTLRMRIDATLRAAMATFMASQEAEVLAKADKLEKIGFRAYLGE